MDKKYKWIRTNRYLKGANPNKVAIELERIKKRHGKLNPSLIVKEAKKKSSYLHKCFPWNIREAAELAWENQAYYILRHIEIVEIVKGKSYSCRGFMPTRITKTDFAPMREIIEDEQMKATMISFAKKEARDWANRYERFVEFTRIVLEIKKVCN